MEVKEKKDYTFWTYMFVIVRIITLYKNGLSSPHFVHRAWGISDAHSLSTELRVLKTTFLQNGYNQEEVKKGAYKKGPLKAKPLKAENENSNYSLNTTISGEWKSSLFLDLHGTW